MKRMFLSPDDGTTGGGAAVLEKPTTGQGEGAATASNPSTTASQGKSASTPPPSSANGDEWNGLVEKFKDAPDEVWDKAIKAATGSKQALLKNVRSSLIEERANALLPDRVKEVETKLTQRIKELEEETNSFKERERLARRELMTDDELKLDDMQQEVDALRAKAARLDTITAAMDHVRAVEAVVGYAKQKWTVLTEDDLEEIRSLGNDPSTPGAVIMDKAMQLASQRMESKLKGVEDLAAEVENLKRQLGGNSTFAATSGSSGGGGEVGDNIERLYFENPRDKDIKKRYESWRKSKHQPVYS
jgi:hypothetical protein